MSRGTSGLLKDYMMSPRCRLPIGDHRHVPLNRCFPACQPRRLAQSQARIAVHKHLHMTPPSVRHAWFDGATLLGKREYGIPFPYPDHQRIFFSFDIFPAPASSSSVLRLLRPERFVTHGCVSASRSRHLRPYSTTSTPPPEDPYSALESPARFSNCRNPVQLEKNITSYLISHPEPSERTLVAMLEACADICRSGSYPQLRPPSGDPVHKVSRKKAGSIRRQSQSQNSTAHEEHLTGSNLGLFQAVLGSFDFTPNQTFKIACNIHDIIAVRCFPSGHPSTAVSNAFLNVCAITGEFEKASHLLDDMIHTSQGDFKPDLTTFRLVLKSAAVYRNKIYPRSHRIYGGRRGSYQGTGVDPEPGTDMSFKEFEAKVQGVIEAGVHLLSRQARVAFTVKMGLGGLAGAAVGKLAMLSVLALPSSRFVVGNPDLGATQGIETSGIIDAAESTVIAGLPMKNDLPVDSVLQMLASQEIAIGIGLFAGILTAGYFILGNSKPLHTIRSTGTHTVTGPGLEVMVHSSGEGGVDRVKNTEAKEILSALLPPSEDSRQQQEQQHQHQHQQHRWKSHRNAEHALPRAKMIGLYFPDLATIDKQEIRDYLCRIFKHQ